MQTLRDIERDHILAALERTDWQATAARASLGLTKRQFFYRCLRYGISVQRRTVEPLPEPGAPPPAQDPRTRSMAGNTCKFCQSDRMLEPDPDHPKLARCGRLKCMRARTLEKSARVLEAEMAVLRLVARSG